MKRMRHGKGSARTMGVHSGSEPRTVHGDGSADSAVNAICRAAKQPTGERTARYASGGKKGHGY